MVSFAAVSLHDRQEENKRLHRLKSVVAAGHLAEDGAHLTAAEIDSFFLAPGDEVPVQEKPVLVSHILDLKEQELTDEDPVAFNPDVVPSAPAPPGNPAGLKDVPERVKVFYVYRNGEVSSIILPVWGKGLWSTLYGYMAIDASDFSTVQGLTYYEHGETPGLGGEVDNPAWKQKWVGRRIFDGARVAIEVIKGSAPPAAEAPYKIDGLSGATLTSRGVSYMLKFWFGDDGYGPFLQGQQQASQAG
jgi:Na+-transporting NADH:ubiquinone oxidoreductase subunit C